jgi:hypothetical protein
MPQIDRRGDTMQTLDSYVAAAQVADRHAAARSARAARRARKADKAADSERLVLRRSSAEDAAALARLARLDSAPRPNGAMLVAEVDERIVAAVPFDGGRAIADPFLPTADIVELLQARAELLAPSARRAPRTRLRLPRVRVA